MTATPHAAAAASPLARFVERVDHIALGAHPSRVDRLPDGRTTIILRNLGGGRGDVVVAGPRTRALYKTPAGFHWAMSLRLKPGWAASVLGVAASDVADRMVRVEELWGRAGADLRDRLLTCRGPAAAAGVLADALTRRAEASFEPASARLARRAVRLIEAGEPRVQRVADQLGVSARHLRRAFSDCVGVGPRDFARATRLQRALRLAANAPSWGEVAAAAGYYDQAHLNGEFRDLLGLTPSAFAARRE